MKTSKSEQGFTHLVLLVLVLVVVGGIGFYVFGKTKATKTQSSTVPATSITKKVSHPGVIQSEVFATSVDTNGAPVQPVSAFPDTTPKIYVSLGLHSAKATQRLEYTRYLNGKFVDQGSLPATKDNAQYASIVFDLKPGKTHIKGKYLVKTYTNGVFERSAQYTVQ